MVDARTFHFYIATVSFIVWQSIGTLANGETRCYCNEASCVRTSYMCKSTHGACFTLLSLDGPTGSISGAAGGAETADYVIRSIHGCVDVLPEVDKRVCDDDVIRNDIDKSRSDGTPVDWSQPLLSGGRGENNWPRLHCCRDDMCNYLDRGSFVLQAFKRNLTVSGSADSARGSGSAAAISGSERSSNDAIITSQHRWGSVGNDVTWFRVAVITVPIIGTIILVILVVMAMRMLRADRRRRRQQHNLLLHHHHHHPAHLQQQFPSFHYCGQPPMAYDAYPNAFDSTNRRWSLVATDRPTSSSSLLPEFAIDHRSVPLVTASSLTTASNSTRTRRPCWFVNNIATRLIEPNDRHFCCKMTTADRSVSCKYRESFHEGIVCDGQCQCKCCLNGVNNKDVEALGSYSAMYPQLQVISCGSAALEGDLDGKRALNGGYHGPQCTRCTLFPCGAVNNV